MNPKYLSTCLVLAIQSLMFSSITAIAGELLSQSQNDEQSHALGNLVELSYTSINTGTSGLSSDLEPGIISVLEKDQLIAAGVRTVAEALTLLPGFDQPEAQLKDDEPILRGIGGIFTGSSGKIRYMVNGTTTNNTISASSSLVLQMPVNQIERIEVLRGPGSAVYGEYALLGVINVITNQQDDQVYMRAGSFDTYSGGGHFTIDHAGDMQSSFDLAYSETAGADIDSGEDLLYALGQSTISNAPGQPNNARRLLSGFYDLSAQSWSLSAFLLSEDRGDGFGTANALSLPQEYVQSATQGGIELKARQKLGKWGIDYQLAAKLFERQYDELLILPAGTFGAYPTGVMGSLSEAELRYEGGVNLSRKLTQHELFLGLNLSHSEARDIYNESNISNQSRIPGTQLGLPLPEVTQQPLGLENRDRNVIGAYFSDQYRMNEDFELVAGLRVDHYSDINDPTLASPRLAGNYQLSANNLLKFQLARAFRPPSFSELYYAIGSGDEGPAGNPELDSEIIDNLELAHVFRLSNTVLRTTLFASEISGLIRIDQTRRFQNALDVESNGLEFEIEHRPHAGLLWFGNLSYLDATDQESGKPLEGSTRWLGNAGFSWQPSGRYSTTLRYHYVGDRFRSAQDTRTALPAYGTFNLSGYVNDFLSNGLTLNAGINNLLDEDIRNPSLQPGYADDYPASGRQYWVQLSKAIN